MKIAITTLDSYRYWRETEFVDPQRERQAFEEIVAKIRGQRIPISSEPALRGIALSRILEDLDKFYDQATRQYHCDGFEFDAQPVLEFNLMVPSDAVREVWMPWHWIEDDYLVGRADNMHGNTIGDVKLISKAFNAKKYDSYEDSIQWQAELLMANCQTFKYYIAQAKVHRTTDVITLANFQELTFYRSAATDERVRTLVIEFSKFAQPYLSETAA